MSDQSKKAHQAVIKARTVLLVSQPFFGCLALHMKLVEIKEKTPLAALCQTMAVDGRNMYFWPEFVLGLTEPELLGVVAHEVMHCAFSHMTRRGHRNPVIYNYAGDYVINDLLLEANFTLPKKRLHDPKYRGMSTEEVYERIKQQVQKQMKAQGQKGKGGGKGQQKGQGGGKGENGDDDGENTIYLPDTDLNIDPGECGGVIDAAGPGDKHGADEVQREWDANVRMAVNVQRRANAGNVPGYLERLVADLDDPKVSWREITRQFIDTSMSKDYSWSRPNRRHAWQGLSLPGFVSDALNHLVMVLDVSGSVDEAMMKTFVSEVAGALADGTADKLTIVYADTHVRLVDEYVPGDVVACKTPGGGGTCFNESFKWIRENASDAACIVYLTDMLTNSFGEDPGIPTLWGCYLPATSLAGINPPFGTKVAVDTTE